MMLSPVQQRIPTEAMAFGLFTGHEADILAGSGNRFVVYSDKCCGTNHILPTRVGIDLQGNNIWSANRFKSAHYLWRMPSLLESKIVLNTT